MKKTLLILFVILFLFSCEDRKEGQVIFISVARNYGSIYTSPYYLKNPTNDQNAIKEQIGYMAEKSGVNYKSIIFSEVEGVRMVNEKERTWSEESFLSFLSSLSLTENDTIVFHYSGHADENGYLVLDDDIDKRLSPNTLLSYLSLTGGKIVMLLDCCYSGTFIKNDDFLANGEVFENNKYSHSSFLSSLSSSFSLLFKEEKTGRANVWIIAAATEGQVAYDFWRGGEEEQRNYGAFSYYLLKALGYDFYKNQASGGGRFSVFELYSDILALLPEDLRKNASPQISLKLLDLVIF